MIASLVFLAILLAGCQAFMDIAGVKRVKKDSDYHVLGAQTDHVIVLFTHNGKCDRPGCKDFEDMLTNFYEENKHLAEYYVMDCQDTLSKDQHRTPVIQECLEDNKKNLPIVLFLVPPVMKFDNKATHLMPLLKFHHKTTYDVESLRRRLIEVQPSFSSLVRDEASYQSFRNIATDKPDLPRVFYFHHGNTRSLDFKLITQEYRTAGALYAEVLVDEYEPKELSTNAYPDLQLPYIIVERINSEGYKDVEIHRNIHRFEDMKEAIENSNFKGALQIHAYYGPENIYDNLQEIIKMDEELKKSKVFHIKNETQLRNFLSNEDYCLGLFYYFNDTEIPEDMISKMINYPDFILIGQVESSLIFPILANFTNDTKFISEISNRDKFKYGGMAMMPPGDFSYKLSNAIVFDELNVTNMMVQTSMRWAKDNVQPIDPNSIQKEIHNTVTNHKILTAFIIDPKVGMPFEYIVNAVNPRFWSTMKFYYYLGNDARVYRALNFKNVGEVPKLAMVHYNRDTFGSKDFFSIHPMEDLARNGYRHFDFLLRSFNDSIATYQDFLLEAKNIAVETTFSKMQDVPKNMIYDDMIVLVIIDDDDIDFPNKFEQLKNSFFTLGLRFYYLKSSCYDDVDELELDPEEINIFLYDLKTKQVFTMEAEELNPFSLKRQLYNMKVGLGKKIKLTRFEGFLSSRDCSGSGRKDVDEIDL